MESKYILINGETVAREFTARDDNDALDKLTNIEYTMLQDEVIRLIEAREVQW